MFKNVIELFNFIQHYLSENNFSLYSKFRNSTQTSYWVLGNELQLKELNAEISGNAVSGYCLEVAQVARNNGTDANTSYYLIINKYERSKRTKIDKIKLYKNYSTTYLANKIDEFILQYKCVLNNINIDELINNLK